MATLHDKTKAEIMATDWPFLREVLEKKTSLTKEEIETGILEFKKYLVLVMSRDFDIAMISPTIDEIWHHFLLFTKEYQEFCDAKLGEFIHHAPNTSVTPVPESAMRNFVTAYTEVFGKIPEIWFKGVDKAVIDFAFGRSNYLPVGFQWSGWPGRRNRK